jgi:hypothetical protein
MDIYKQKRTCDHESDLEATLERGAVSLVRQRRNAD